MDVALIMGVACLRGGGGSSITQSSITSFQWMDSGLMIVCLLATVGGVHP
jgi:hypothetical protein